MDILIEPQFGNQDISLTLDPQSTDQELGVLIGATGGLIGISLDRPGDQAIDLIFEQRENISLIIEQISTIRPESMYKIEMTEYGSFPEVVETNDGVQAIYTFRIPRITEEIVIREIREEIDIGDTVALFENKLL